jgi:Transposase DNA-binding/Transposase Tn5 dimerisation domain/Transposase DDE domain
MLPPWVTDEMKTADLKDKRLDARLREVLSQLATQPTASIPAACGGYAETAAAYRFFDNEKVTFDNVLQPHQAATRQRLAAQDVAILVQDTTELDMTRPAEQVFGAGPLDGSRYGALLHLLAAFTPDGTPLGTLAARAWVRDEQAVRTASLTRAERAATPFVEKESHRWVEFLEHTQAIAAEVPQTRLICVADSEADIYELLVAGQQEPRRVHWIIRACQNRALVRPREGEYATEPHIREQALAQPVLFRQTIEVRAHEPKVSCETRARRQVRKARTTDVEVRAAMVKLRGPWRPDRKLPEIEIRVVLVREISPPPGEEPVEWLLLTSLPVEDAEQVRKVIDYYRTRWMIEIFFRTLKQGCRVEERRFEHLDRLLPCVAVFLIVAWRTLFVCRLGRSTPDVSCESVFEPSEWKAAYRVVRRKSPPRRPPPLGEMVRLVAQLGGYINRPRHDPPGPQTVWIGLQRTRDFALCWDMFGPEAKTRHQLV